MCLIQSYNACYWLFEHYFSHIFLLSSIVLIPIYSLVFSHELYDRVFSTDFIPFHSNSTVYAHRKSLLWLRANHLFFCFSEFFFCGKDQLKHLFQFILVHKNLQRHIYEYVLFIPQKKKKSLEYSHTQRIWHHSNVVEQKRGKRNVEGNYWLYFLMAYHNTHNGKQEII